MDMVMTIALDIFEIFDGEDEAVGDEEVGEE